MARDPGVAGLEGEVGELGVDGADVEVDAQSNKMIDSGSKIQWSCLILKYFGEV